MREYPWAHGCHKYCCISSWVANCMSKKLNCFHTYTRTTMHAHTHARTHPTMYVHSQLTEKRMQECIYIYQHKYATTHVTLQGLKMMPHTSTKCNCLVSGKILALPCAITVTNLKVYTSGILDHLQWLMNERLERRGTGTGHSYY